MENSTEHSLTIKNRESIILTGVSDVDSFNEEEICAVCSCGQLNIKGELLHIEELNIDEETMSVTGKIISITYSENFSSTSVLKRLFGG